jgi:putative transposase
MLRRTRFSLPGIPWHIIQRANNREACFYAEQDLGLYPDHLQELATRLGSIPFGRWRTEELRPK